MGQKIVSISLKITASVAFLCGLALLTFFMAHPEILSAIEPIEAAGGY